MKSALSKIINGISILIMACAVLILVSAVMSGVGSVPQVAGFSMFRVLTGSMEPTIPTGSMVLVKRLDNGKADLSEEIQVGDIITFYADNEITSHTPTTHRVVEITEDGNYITQGDANAVADKEPVTPSDILGKVVFSSKFIGTLIRLVSNPLVFFPLIIIPLLAIIFLNLRDSWRNTKQLMKEEEEEVKKEAERLAREELGLEGKKEEGAGDGTGKEGSGSENRIK